MDQASKSVPFLLTDAEFIEILHEDDVQIANEKSASQILVKSEANAPSADADTETPRKPIKRPFDALEDEQDASDTLINSPKSAEPDLGLVEEKSLLKDSSRTLFVSCEAETLDNLKSSHEKSSSSAELLIYSGGTKSNEEDDDERLQNLSLEPVLVNLDTFFQTLSDEMREFIEKLDKIVEGLSKVCQTCFGLLQEEAHSKLNAKFQSIQDLQGRRANLQKELEQNRHQLAQVVKLFS